VHSVGPVRWSRSLSRTRPKAVAAASALAAQAGLTRTLAILAGLTRTLAILAGLAVAGVLSGAVALLSWFEKSQLRRLVVG
jgi:hypothetical protein